MTTDVAGTCHCGAQTAGIPQLDARAIPHEIRHGAVLGALQSLPPGGSLILVAPHDPVPLLRKVHDSFPGAFDVGYVERGPQAWRLRFTRTSDREQLPVVG